MAHNNKLRPIELLAPARNAEIAIEAIRHGADAVYIGASSHGARSAAGNSLDDIKRVVDFAHQFNAKVYVTVNTIIYDRELAQVEQLVGELYRVGVDALIVQDMALLRMNIPPIALHASTQCDIRTPGKAEFLQRAGFSQLVLARELTLEETAEIHSRVSVPLEAFVHGALCVSYSGDCQAGFATMGRSANRGQCPQICRHKFDLLDESGRKLIEGKHLLSLRDLNRSASLADMIEAGVSSFKIEGRLKDADYVKNVVASYRRRLDEIINANPDKYVRSSYGRSEVNFTPDLNASFNRGFTDYFTRTPRPAVRMASADTPKWIGQPVGKVITASGNRIRARLTSALANGDGLGYFDSKGEFVGFRLNRIEGQTLIAAKTLADIPSGATIYRNSDRLRQQRLEGATATRTIDIDMTLRATSRGLAIDLSDCAGNHASVATDIVLEQARTPQQDARRGVLTKTGDSVYRVARLTDNAGNLFIPKSTLADLRRRAIEALDRTKRASYRFDYRQAEQRNDLLPADTTLTYHDNVANRLAESFYRDHGAQTIQPAAETQTSLPDKMTVMTTRYCLRREYGRCLHTPAGKEWPRRLYLQSGPMRLTVEFDCAACRMHILKEK